MLRIHLTPLFGRCVQALRKKGGTALMSARKIDAFMEALRNSASNDIRKKFSTTFNGECRIKNCKKIDLIGAYRMVCIEKDNNLVLLYAGSHEECFRWIERNKGLTYNVSNDSDEISVAGDAGQGVVETLPEDVLEERRFVQEYERTLKSKLDDKTLYSIFRNLIVFLFLSLAVLVSPAIAAEDRFVDTAQLKAMLDDKKDFTLVDARTKEEYEEAHIIKAINITEKYFEAQSSRLPSDKKALLVIYCNGVKCGKSKKVAAKADAAGFTNIMIYAEGFPVWEEKGLPIVAGPEYSKKTETAKLRPEDIKKLPESGKEDYVIVDVRDETEYMEGHIPGAINIPAEMFAAKSEILPKEKKIIVYCNTGGRSYTAYRKLIKLAYPHIFQTMFADWKEAGQKVEK